MALALAAIILRIPLHSPFRRSELMSSRPGGSRLLNLVVLLAMFITAIAFTVGLAANSGIDLMASAVAGGALFMVMASSHFVIMRELHSSPLDPRVQELEEAVIVL